VFCVAVSAAQAVENKGAFHGAGSFSIPAWFKHSFLDLGEDIRDAAADNKRVMVYFHQNGCPYCAALVNNNFSQKHIVDYMKQHFDSVDINMFGDREVIDLQGKSVNEKTFAANMKVWFTPTLVFFDEKGKVALRINGYYKPHELMAALQYVAEKKEGQMPFREYYAKLSPPASSGKLNSEAFFAKPPYALDKVNNDFIAVFFEQKDCQDCDRLHKEVLSLPDTQEQIKRFHTIQLDRWSNTPLVTPTGEKTTAKAWANKLNVAYVPSVVLFDKGKEIIRIEAFLKSFHVQSVFDYVSSRGYKKETSFQRYIEKRAEHIREQGKDVDIWK
jgi:thioredoxin-related protein